MGTPSAGMAPATGEPPVRLMWSAISTGWPTERPSVMPPAALVSTTAVHPAAWAVRTAWATALGAWPS